MEDFVKPDFVSVGPLRQGLEARLTPHADGQPTRVVLSGARAYTRYLMARELAENRYDNTSKQTLNQFDEALTKPFVSARREVLTSLRHAGLSVKYDEVAVEKMSELSGRIHARYSRWYPVEDDQGNITDWKFHPGTVRSTDKAKAKAALDHLGWDQHLFEFAYEGAQEILTKRDVLLAAPVGTGKTRLALALAETWRYMDSSTGPTIILANRRHLSAWREELGGVPEKKPCELIVRQYGPACYEEWIEKDDMPNFDKPFLLVSLDRAKIFTDKQLAAFLRVAGGSTILLDESYVIANRNTQVSRFIQKVSGLHHVALSGTPVRGYIDSLLHVLQFVHRGGSIALPDYPTHRDGSSKKWNEKYLQFASAEGGGRRRVPFIRNQEDFWKLMEPLMFRMLRNEPQIEKVLGPANIEEVNVQVELSDLHMKTYRAVLQQFIDWYQREIEARRKRDEGEGRRRLLRGRHLSRPRKRPARQRVSHDLHVDVPNRRRDAAVMPEQEILVKLSYMVNNVRAPWRMEDHSDEDFQWPAHPRELTSVHEKAIEILEQEIAEGHGVLIFGVSVDAMSLLTEKIAERGISVGLIHGGISQKEREEVIARSRRGELICLVGTYGTLAEGLNLSHMSRVILTDTDWTPSTMKQALGRITRGIQEVQPRAYFIEAAGTIQSYMLRLNKLKQAAMDNSLDRRKLLVGADEIPDIQAYAASLIGVDDPQEVQERLFFIEEDAS